MTFGFIAAEKATFPVRTLCRVLAVSPSGYYAWAVRQGRPRVDRDLVLRHALRVAHAESRGRYGSPRLHHVLQRRGHRVGRHRVMRLMRAEGLRARGRRRFRAPTTGDVQPPAPNHLRRGFHATALNERWAADMTMLATGQGPLHLAVILDLYARRVIGWALRPAPDTSLAAAALHMALRRRRPGPGTLHHSDRGAAYASRAYRALLAAHGLVASMSRPRNCWDNAVVESFFSTLKQEASDRWGTHAEAGATIAEYIEQFYNPVRLHSTLGYQTPVAYEQATDQ